MSKVALAVAGIVALCIGTGFIGWHLRPDCPADPVPTTQADSALEAIAAANARADSLLRDTLRVPVYLRTNAATENLAASDTATLFRILDADPSAE